EGMPRHASTHAAGVVITPEPVDCYLPLATNDGLPVTQFNMTEIEELGLLKMDFLGLRTLTVIRDAETAVQKTTRLSQWQSWITTTKPRMRCWAGARPRACSSWNLRGCARS